jgi:hypothetical protein
MPAYVHGRNAVVHIDDATGASRNLSGDMNSVTIAWSKDNPTVTTFGDNHQQRVPGIGDATLNGAFIWNGDDQVASSIAQLFLDIQNASTINLIKVAPAGSVTGCPLYTACWVLSAFDINAPVSGVVAGTFAWQLASGSVTNASCV